MTHCLHAGPLQLKWVKSSLRARTFSISIVLHGKCMWVFLPGQQLKMLTVVIQIQAEQVMQKHARDVTSLPGTREPPPVPSRPVPSHRSLSSLHASMYPLGGLFNEDQACLCARAWKTHSWRKNGNDWEKQETSDQCIPEGARGAQFWQRCK